MSPKGFKYFIPGCSDLQNLIVENALNSTYQTCKIASE